MTTLELIRSDGTHPPNTVFPNYVILLKFPTLSGEGSPMLTKRCASLKELDEEIRLIKSKLDEISAGAHKRWPEG